MKRRRKLNTPADYRAVGWGKRSLRTDRQIDSVKKAMDSQEVQLLAFVSSIGKELTFQYYNKEGKDLRVTVSMRKCEVRDGSVLVSAYGSGNTVNRALRDYAKQLSCKTLVFDAFSSSRTEMQTPKLIHSSKALK